MQNKTVIFFFFFEILDSAVILPLLIYLKKAIFLIFQQCSLTSVVFGEIHNKWLLSSFQIRKQRVSEFVYRTSENQRVLGIIPSQDRQLFPILTLIYVYFLLASKQVSKIRISHGCVYTSSACNPLYAQHCTVLVHVLLHSARHGCEKQNYGNSSSDSQLQADSTPSI